MAASKFTEDQIKFLRSNPYVVSVTQNVISLSKEFKKLLWIEMEKGRDIREILEEHGLPCSVLGETRISGIKGLVRNTARSGGKFTDTNSMASQANGFMTPEKRIKQLELMLEYKDQEIEFLKKMVSLAQEE